MNTQLKIPGLPTKLEICGYYQAQRYLVAVNSSGQENRLWLPKKPFRYITLMAEAYSRDSDGWIEYQAMDTGTEQRVMIYQLRKHINEQLGDSWLHPVEIDSMSKRARLNVDPRCQIFMDAERLSAIADGYIKRSGFRLLSSRTNMFQELTELPGSSQAV